MFLHISHTEHYTSTYLKSTDYIRFKIDKKVKEDTSIGGVEKRFKKRA